VGVLIGLALLLTLFGAAAAFLNVPERL